MNKLMKFPKVILTIVMMLCVALPTLAHKFEVNGIYYDYLDKTAKTVAVTYKGYNSETYSNEYTGSVTIPSSVTYSGTTYSVTSIGDMAFTYCTGLTSITIPNSVTSIGKHAFYSCTGLTSITIPNSVISIGDTAFYNCPGLTSVTIPNSVTSIGDMAFYGCSGLTSVTIPNSVSSIGDYAFGNCSGLTSVTIPNSVTSIGNNAFRGCTGLTSITIPNSVTSIGDMAFYGCSGLTEVNITDLSAWCKIDFVNYLTNPLYYAKKLKLNGTEIKDLVIPNDITEIKNCAFSYCTGLTSITIPNSVTSIGNDAFRGCSGLTLVTIPNSVTSIGEEAFEYCYSLKTIVSLNPTPPACAGSNSFYSNNYSNATLYVPKDSYAKYFIDEAWGLFSNIKKIETTATSISLDKSSLTLDKGATKTIKASITPSNTTLSLLNWTSDNPAVAIVNQSGNVTAISAGTANITVMALDGSNVSASCNVTVNASNTQITLSQTEVSLPVNDIMTLTYTVANSANKTVTWSTSDANVAAIRTNSDGSVVIAGISDGVATITATANDGSGASASCVVTVGVGGIEGVEVDDNAVEVARYDIHGRLLSEPARGINIVKYSDGSTRKEIVKE